MKISISVPKPCHENWNAMAPADSGRHCDRCQHTVMDLTRTSDAELVDLFRKDAMPKCARFTQSQLDRVIALEERSARLLPAAAVGAALAFAAPDASAQNCTPQLGKMAITSPVQPLDLPQVGQTMVVPVEDTDPILDKVELGNVAITGDTIATVIERGVKGEVEIRSGRGNVFYYIDGVKAPAGAGTVMPRSMVEEVHIITGGLPVDFGDHVEVHQDTITGRVLDSDGAPLPFANVRVRGAECGAITDEEGHYVVALPRSINSERSTLIISAIGYTTREVEVPAFVKTPADATCPYNDKAPLTGRVAWADGHSAAGVEVELPELGLRCITDVRGFYSFDHPVGNDRGTIAIVATDAAGGTGRAKADVNALPCCVPIQMTGTGPDSTKSGARMDLGDAVMTEAEMILLGEFATHEVRKDSLLSRAARPFRRIGERISRVVR